MTSSLNNFSCGRNMTVTFKVTVICLLAAFLLAACGGATAPTSTPTATPLASPAFTQSLTPTRTKLPAWTATYTLIPTQTQTPTFNPTEQIWATGAKLLYQRTAAAYAITEQVVQTLHDQFPETCEEHQTAFSLSPDGTLSIGTARSYGKSRQEPLRMMCSIGQRMMPSCISPYIIAAPMAMA